MFLTAKILGLLPQIMAYQTLWNFERIILVRKVAGKRIRGKWNGHIAMKIGET